jgi:hypothetical protein
MKKTGSKTTNYEIQDGGNRHLENRKSPVTSSVIDRTAREFFLQMPKNSLHAAVVFKLQSKKLGNPRWWQPPSSD